MHTFAHPDNMLSRGPLSSRLGIHRARALLRERALRPVGFIEYAYRVEICQRVQPKEPVDHLPKADIGQYLALFPRSSPLKLVPTYTFI